MSNNSSIIEQQQIADYEKVKFHGYRQDYQTWCSEEYSKFLKHKLSQHLQRNFDFLKSIGHSETLINLNKTLLNKPKSLFRGEVEDNIFLAWSSLSGCSNSVYMELSKESLDEIVVKYLLDKIDANIKIIGTH